MTTERSGRTRIFNGLPADLFGVFAGSKRWFYADLLEYIDRQIFGDEPGVVSWRTFMESMREYIDREARDVCVDDQDGPTGPVPSGIDSRAFVFYTRLVKTGWLIEMRDRYRRIVDMNPNARLVLTTLLEIKEGKTRSYGGEVLQVLLQLEGADRDPENRSEAIRNAARSARSFMHHLRSIASAVRQIEEDLIDQTDMRTLFRRFFTDFVEKFLISDFKQIKSTTNPFRFRRKIIDTAEGILANDERIAALAESYVREGREERLEQAKIMIESELKVVIHVFEAVGSYLDLIEAANQRLERRISNTIRFMDRIAESSTERVVEALEKLGSLAGDGETEIGVAHALIGGEPLVGQDDLYQHKKPREAYRPQKLRRRPVDPAFIEYRKAADAYRARGIVNAVKMGAYLEWAMGDRREIRASELPIRSLDDFFVFERLRALRQIDEGALAGRFDVETTSSTFENEWITCPDFAIRRKRVGPHARA